jgi:hypothetical protein
MIATLTQNGCILTREDEDKRIGKESTVVFHMRNLLNAQGYKFVRMYPNKRGLTSCRLGLWDKKAAIILWHERYAIEDAAETFNKSGTVWFMRTALEG